MAIFVFSYFRAFVIDSISSHHNSFHDKRRGYAEARCAEILAESGSNSWPMGVPPDRSRKHESTKARRNQEPGLYLVLAVRGQRQTPLFGNGPPGQVTAEVCAEQPRMAAATSSGVLPPVSITTSASSW